MKLFKTFSITAKSGLEVVTDLFETAEQGSKLLLAEATKARIETALDADLEWSDSEAVAKAFEAVLKLDTQLSNFRASSRARG
jgi:hypothetical protein|uniref:Uncharacterized protein n=1 Tax=Podoviridae sp. ctiuS14 TaxID=2827620 RepID=A0A8S5LM33_9CAUD|nr:MAG TPA: hypothetical protein [Podoviridae sp. ctiuS14]